MLLGDAGVTSGTVRSISRVRGWQPGELDVSGRRLQRTARTLEDEMATVKRGMDGAFSSWSGPAADAAAGHVADRVKTGLAVADTVSEAGTVLISGAASLGEARQHVLSLVSEAESQGFSVADDGSVMPPPVPPVADMPTAVLSAAVDPGAAQEAEEQRLATGAADWATRIGEALRRVGEVDRHVAQRLEGLELPTSV